MWWDADFWPSSLASFFIESFPEMQGDRRQTSSSARLHEPIERVCTDRRFLTFDGVGPTEVVETCNLIQINADTNGISNGLIDTCSRRA